MRAGLLPAVVLAMAAAVRLGDNAAAVQSSSSEDRDTELLEAERQRADAEKSAAGVATDSTEKLLVERSRSIEDRATESRKAKELDGSMLAKSGSIAQKETRANLMNAADEASEADSHPPYQLAEAVICR
eukprot:TRINITY_DN36279_c0_g1_i4.p1 TRINITY_DN36279_c0_g1~~TRINITY_DN36279_c0_g1_i4.p1  ORF type:complete len:130 (-),score=22.92 TRINITY_DN36279_c0_g1_i4:276-665(-)